MDVLTFGDLLRSHRLTAGLSQEALAERSGLSTLEVSHLERGQRRGPRRATVAALVAALGLSTGQAAALEEAAHRRRQPRPARPVRPSGLPRAETPLLGRETDLAVLPFLLRQADGRLLTLVGPAGVGKTRLALEVAVRLAASVPDGLTWVDLAPLHEAGLVAPTLAARLGLRTDTATDTAILVAHLQSRDALLVLDNLEHLLPAGALLQQLLDACPRLRILATSRVKLGLRGERSYALSPLALPPPGEDDPQRVEEYAAVALFLERARIVAPGLALTTSTAPVVAAVCCRLDGLPLAIELAAALVRLLPPQAMLARLSAGALDPPGAAPGLEAGARPGGAGATLDLLASGSWDRPDRQQTMRHAVAWSYDLLTPEGQALFRRLAIFVGGCTREAAEAVCRRSGDRDTREGVGELVEHSLLRAEGLPNGDTRLLMLETIRAYGLERLETYGEAAAVQRAHAEYYLALAETAEPELTGPKQAPWIERIEREHDNLRAALRWARAQAQGETGLRLAAALGRFWLIRGYLREGRAWLDGALGTHLPPSGTTAVRAAALHWAGSLALHQADYVVARAHLEQGLALCRMLADQQAIARALSALGVVAYRQGDYTAARALHDESLTRNRELANKARIAASLGNLGLVVVEQGEYALARTLHVECLALCRELEDTWGVGIALSNVGGVENHLGHYATARARHEECLALCRALGDRQGIAESLTNLAVAACGQQEYGEARSLLEESLVLARELGDTRVIANALSHLGVVSVQRGDYAAARSLYQESVTLRRDAGYQQGIAWALERYAELVALQGQPEQAVRLCGAAERLRAEISAPRAPADQASYEHTLEAARGALKVGSPGGAGVCAAAWAAGQALSLEQAMAAVLRDVHPA